MYCAQQGSTPNRPTKKKVIKFRPHSNVWYYTIRSWIFIIRCFGPSESLLENKISSNSSSYSVISMFSIPPWTGWMVRIDRDASFAWVGNWILKIENWNLELGKLARRNRVSTIVCSGTEGVPVQHSKYRLYGKGQSPPQSRALFRYTRNVDLETTM